MLSDENIEELAGVESSGSMPLLSVIHSSQDQETMASRMGSQHSSSTRIDECSKTPFEGSVSRSASGFFQDNPLQISQAISASSVDNIGCQIIYCTKRIQWINEAKKSKFLSYSESLLLDRLEKIYAEILKDLDAVGTLHNIKNKYKEIDLLIENTKKIIMRKKNELSKDEVSFSILHIETISFIQSRELFVDDDFPMSALNEQLSKKIKKISLKIIKEIKEECINYQLHLQSLTQKVCSLFIGASTESKKALMDELLEILAKQDTSPEVKLVQFNMQFERVREFIEEPRSSLTVLQGTSTEGKKLSKSIHDIISANANLIHILEETIPTDAHSERQGAEAESPRAQYFF